MSTLISQSVKRVITKYSDVKGIIFDNFIWSQYNWIFMCLNVL